MIKPEIKDYQEYTFTYKKKKGMQEKDMLFSNNTRVKRVGAFINAANIMQAVNQLCKKCKQPIFKREDDSFMWDLIDGGYIKIGQEEDAYDDVNNIQYNYYCEMLLEA